ncbi:Sas10/U3 ribonucleoprotein (Utp) family protein [Actinidia rufa]|uniref:Sas10/U3 ribonucleoprotein (Utp) family protein n=1 Tax=Actinidia rufa TaxID=165716 RepID=A0A7J0EA67_9ERIC|nr:Sas10/U3 ribonucleoprotein (Utp) family protein [Actinidia rufa]
MYPFENMMVFGDECAFAIQIVFTPVLSLLQSSDEEQPAEEEAEVLRLQKEKAKSLSMEDFGLEDVSQDESDGEPTLEEILGKGKAGPKSSADKEARDEPVYEEVKKDLNALSKEEQMDVVYSSAPELVGLLSELNDALEELENKVNPLLRKVKEGGNTMKAGMHYMEVKQLLLMAYCQAITFYLLLKSEGQPVRDHPVIARLVEIKNLLDKAKELDVNLPSDLENILGKKIQTETVAKSLGVDVAMASDSLINSDMHAVGKQEATVVPREAVQVLKVESSKNDESKGRKRKHLDDQVGMQSMEMLKVRSALEEKLKQKGIFGSIASKHDRVQKRSRPLNGQLETLDDFDDEATDLGKVTPGMSKGHATSLSSNLHCGDTSHTVGGVLCKKILRAEENSSDEARIGKAIDEACARAVSGDDDLPMRDDIGESLESDEEDDMEDGVQSESADELHEQAKQQRAAKLAAKAEMYSRTSAVQSNPEETLVDGKRHITYQMEKNRGLTRARKKLTKNPRKKYKLKHQKAVVRRKGQVRDIKKPTGPYGGEASGINAGISRSIRFKS